MDYYDQNLSDLYVTWKEQNFNNTNDNKTNNNTKSNNK